jgi:hypothetical protein
MKKVFSLKRNKLSNKLSGKDNGKVAVSGANHIITLVKRSPEELSKSRCSAYTYLIP